MGADFVVSARGFMFSLGCIQALKCASGKCPTGVTASDPNMIKGLDPTDKAVRAMRYAERVIEEVEIIAHSCGLTDPSGLRAHHVTAVERGVSGFRVMD
jgi:glutamate synthase domain-containing protein 2